MRWTAVVPLKLGPDRKSRLAPLFSPNQRVAISDIIILAPGRGVIPDVRWVLDEGPGLNAELDILRATLVGPLLILHADLRLLDVADVEAMIAAAMISGSAIAPDRHGLGSNAVAMARPVPSLAFAFGADSFASHRRMLGDSAAAVVRQNGLSHDLDTAADLAAIEALGFRF